MATANGSVITTVRIPRLEDAEEKIERLQVQVRTLILVVVIHAFMLGLVGTSVILLALDAR